MWDILETPKATKALDKLPVEIIKKYEKWKDVVKYSGPSALRLMSGLRDEALKGEWFGYRSLRLSLKYRVIYQVRKDEVRVIVMDINAHRY